MGQVPVFKPLIQAEEIDAAVASLELGWLGMGSYVDELEQALARYLELDDGYHLALVNTGHSALHLACVLAGCGPGDEVIAPAFCCVSDFQAILQTGADVVLCDVRDEDLTVDLSTAAPLVTERTKAIIAQDYGANVCDHQAVADFADVHGLRVIHDAAHTFGSRYQGKRVGAFSDMTMLSFDPVKTMTCLDAGALIVRDEAELERVHKLRILGMGQPPAVMYQNKRAWTFGVDGEGYRYHLLNLHAAIGLQQLAKMDRIADTRRAAFRYYLDGLDGIEGLRLPVTDLDQIVPFIFVVRVEGGRRDEFRKYLGECGVDTGVHWQPGHHFKVLEGCRRGDLSVSQRAGEEICSLPLHSEMDRGDQDRVIEAVRGYFAGRPPVNAGESSALEQIAAAE